MNQNKKADTSRENKLTEAERDLLALADISTDKQLEDIKSGKLKKDETRK